MQRKLLKEFTKWLESPRRKCLIIRGARQVGKTWFVRDAASRLGKQLLEINFEEQPDLAKCFAHSRSPGSIVSALEVALATRITADTLLFLDEIQACPDAYIALKFFSDKMPDLPVVAAGSHLGILEQMADVSHPVGYVNDMTLYPMDFEEFATSLKLHPQCLQALTSPTAPSQVVHDQLMETYRTYLFVGGLPECVGIWNEKTSLLEGVEAVRLAQKELLSLYKSDFSKYHGSQSLNLVATWEAVAHQLHLTVDSSTNRFKFKDVLKGKKEYAQFRDHFQRLAACGLIRLVPVIGHAYYPLKQHLKDSMFKAFYFDTGILLCELDFSYQALMANSAISYKGFLTENYVACQLKPELLSLYNYKTKTGEVEFVFQDHQEIISLEVKNNNLKAKSLQAFIAKYQPSKAFKLSAHPYFRRDLVENLALYQVGTLSPG